MTAYSRCPGRVIVTHCLSPIRRADPGDCLIEPTGALSPPPDRLSPRPSPSRGEPVTKSIALWSRLSSRYPIVGGYWWILEGGGPSCGHAGVWDGVLQFTSSSNALADLSGRCFLSLEPHQRASRDGKIGNRVHFTPRLILQLFMADVLSDTSPPAVRLAVTRSACTTFPA